MSCSAHWGQTIGYDLTISPSKRFFNLPGINIPVCVIAIIGYVFVLKLRPPQSKKASEMVRRIDWGGAAFCITGVTLFLLGLTWSLTSGWGSARCLGPLLAGVACMVGFVLFEWKVPKEPAVPLALFTIRNFAISCVASFCIGYGMTGTPSRVVDWICASFRLTPSRYY